MGQLPTVLLVGASGMLGTDLFKALGPVTTWKLITLKRDKLDITNASQTKKVIEDLKPAVVINSAAYTDVDGAEREKEKAFAVNVQGPRNLIAGCATVGAKLVHFSTDQVFDGTGQKPWTEESTPNPLNYYAETKLMGEKPVLEDEEGLVIRVQWLYGQKKDRFTPLKQKEIFTPFSDQYGSPTWTRNVADTVRDLIRRDASGLFHFAYDDFASWADVFSFVRTELNLKVKLEPKRTEEMKLPARRPKFSVLSNQKLVNCLGLKGMGSWRGPLREFLRHPV